MKILVCDDSIINRQVVGAYIRQMGHEPVYADNGAQAVEVFAAEDPELVLIDVEMPGMDGYEATRAIRHSHSDFSQWTPIIFISSNIDDASLVKGIEAGGDDYLAKPVRPAVLRAKIHAMRRLALMREKLAEFSRQLREVNDKLLQSNQFLSELSLKDPLTLLSNRRAFEETLLRSCRNALREGKAICMLMIDVDNFKLLNDTYGHQTGDYCLQEIGVILTKAVHRASDFVSRYGGEEFAILLVDTPMAGALHVAERIRKNVEMLKIPNEKSERGYITVSVGGACAPANVEFSPEVLVATADYALYQAKENGRNCIWVAKEMLSDIEVEQKKHKYQWRFPPTSSSSKH